MTIILICDKKYEERQRALAALLGEVVGQLEAGHRIGKNKTCLVVDVTPQVVLADER